MIQSESTSSGATETITLGTPTYGYLSQVQGPLAGNADVTNYTFYGLGLVHTKTDSEGQSWTYSYDNLNRQTAVTYQDGTSELTVYDKLDAVMHSDRLGRWTKDTYDRMDQKVCEVDPLGRTTKWCWCTCGSLASITDPAGNVTTWNHDANGNTINWVFQPNTSLVQSRTDALSQVASYAYNIDNTQQETTYTNGVNATSPVTQVYDTKFPRTTGIINGWGQRTLSYNPYPASLTDKAFIWIGGYPETPSATDTINITFFNSALSGGQYTMPTYTVASGDAGLPAQVATHLASAITSNATLSAAGISASVSGTLVTVSAGSAVTVTPSGTGSTTATVGGGGRLAQVTNSVIPNSPVCLSYDSLGRTTTQMINGGNNSDSWYFDAMSRITSEQNVLGTFNYAYVDDTTGSSKGTLRLASVNYPNGMVTNFSYLPNIGDQRLQQSVTLGPPPSSPVLFQLGLAYNSAGENTQRLKVINGTTTHMSLGYDLASQLITAPSDSGSTFNAYISGTPNVGDVVSVTAYDASLTGTTPPGQEAASYTVMSGDTSAAIASNLATAIGSAMSNISVTASASSNAIVTIITSGSNATSFTAAVTGTGATDTIALSGSSPAQPFSNQIYYGIDAASNITSIQGNSTGSFPTGLTTTVTQYAINNVNQITSASSGGAVTFQGTTVNPVKSAVINISQTATVAGTGVTPGDVVTIVVHNAALSQGEVVSYTVQTGDSFTSIASALTAAINTDSTLSGIGVTATSSGAVVTIGSSSINSTTYSVGVSSGATETLTLGGSLSTPATLNSSQSFSGNPVLATGSNTASVTAVSGGGTPATNTYPITVPSGTSQSFTHDANGNMTGDGTNTYAWDCENRLIQINYPGTSNYSQFTYDGAGNRVKIVEVRSGTTTSTQQFVFSGNVMCEARDGSGNVTKQFFAYGENIGGSNYYFGIEAGPGSIVVMTDSSGNPVAQYSFDPYGVKTTILETVAADFQYAGDYFHGPSGFSLTKFRVYSPTIGRWLSRDPIGERAGVNLFTYVSNNPISFVDPLGLLGSCVTCHMETYEEGKRRCEETREGDYAICDQICDPQERANCYELANKRYDECIANLGNTPAGPPP